MKRTAAIDEANGCGLLTSAEVERALAGTLDPERAAAFAAHVDEGCGACALLAADLDVYRWVTTRGPIDAERRAFERGAPVARAVLRAELERLAPPRRRWLRAWLPTLAMAAAAAVVLMIAVGPWREAGGPASIILADGGRFVPPPIAWSAPETLRGGTSLAQRWQRAGAAYLEGEWAAAASELEAIEGLDPDSVDAPLYRGSALLALGRYADAVPVLERAVERGERIGLAGAGAWYELGVARLGAGDAAAARVALDRSRQAGGKMGRRAAELIERINGPQPH